MSDPAGGEIHRRNVGIRTFISVLSVLSGVTFVLGQSVHVGRGASTDSVVLPARSRYFVLTPRCIPLNSQSVTITADGGRLSQCNPSFILSGCPSELDDPRDDEQRHDVVSTFGGAGRAG